MPTLKEIIDEKLSRLEEIPDTFYKGVGKAQEEVLRRLLELLGTLDTKAGIIQATEANLIIAEQIKQELQKVLFQGEYYNALLQFGKEFSVQAAINNQYFEKVFDFELKEMYRATLRASQKTAIDLLAETAIDNRFLIPMRQQLDSSIVTGQSFSDAVKRLTNFIEGEDDNGILMRYTKQVARDTFSVADRQYSQVIADDLELEWYVYRGGRVKDTRKFCDDRNGKYFHRSEIEAMASETWVGKIPQTDNKTIFVYCGGWNCLHTWMPVSEFDVPEEVKNRVKVN